MRVRFATPAGAALLSVLLLLLTGCGGMPERRSHDGTTCTGELTGPGPVYLTAWFHTALGDAVARIDRNLAAHRYYQPSEP